MKYEYTYWVDSEEDIDNFDECEASMTHGYEGWKLAVKSTGDIYIPSYWQQENGDFTGFMGWK